MRTYPFNQLEVVGFTGTLDEGSGPQFLAPVFQLMDQSSDRNIVVPPLKVTVRGVEAHGEPITQREWSEMLALKDATPEPLGEAREEHVLWFDGEGFVLYTPREEASNRLRDIAEGHLEAAWELIDREELSEAFRLLRKAATADSRSKQVWIAQGVVYRLANNLMGLLVLHQTVESLFPGWNIRPSINMRLKWLGLRTSI